MTKAQLKTTLSSKYPTVGDETKWVIISNQNTAVFEALGYQVVVIPVIDGTTDAKWDNNIVVITDGTNYFWRNGEPNFQNFAIRLQNYIDSAISSGTIQFGVIKDMNQDLSKATVNVYMPDNSAKLLLVTETSLNNFIYKAIG